MGVPCVNEQRIAKLETKTAVNDTSINNLVEKLKDLTLEIKWLIRLMIASLLGIVGALIKMYVL